MPPSPLETLGKDFDPAELIAELASCIARLPAHFTVFGQACSPCIGGFALEVAHLVVHGMQRGNQKPNFTTCARIQFLACRTPDRTRAKVHPKDMFGSLDGFSVERLGSTVLCSVAFSLTETVPLPVASSLACPGFLQVNWMPLDWLPRLRWVAYVCLPLFSVSLDCHTFRVRNGAHFGIATKICASAKSLSLTGTKYKLENPLGTSSNQVGRSDHGGGNCVKGRFSHVKGIPFKGQIGHRGLPTLVSQISAYIKGIPIQRNNLLLS